MCYVQCVIIALLASSHAWHGCGLFLLTLHFRGLCFACVLDTSVSAAKTDEPIEIVFVTGETCGPKTGY